MAALIHQSGILLSNDFSVGNILNYLTKGILGRDSMVNI